MQHVIHLEEGIASRALERSPSSEDQQKGKRQNIVTAVAFDVFGN